MPTQPPIALSSVWAHRLAWCLALVVFPLIWVGGLVTTYDAGMAVPDWPTTYGYNLLLYPWTTWLLGPWDLFIEHGHRLLGALAGLVSLSLVGLVWWKQERRVVRYAAAATALAVAIQGVLGGIRVWAADERVAQLHGCTGPLVFCLAVLLVWLTQRSVDGRHQCAGADRSLGLLAWIFAGAVYAQLILGSFLRHVLPAQPPATFRLMVLGHVTGALAVTVLAIVVVVRSRRLDRGDRRRWLSGVVAALVAFQLLLGAGTWIVKYNWPGWLGSSESAGVVLAEGMGQSLVVTGHVATGSLILALSVLLAATMSLPFPSRARPADQRPESSWRWRRPMEARG